MGVAEGVDVEDVNVGGCQGEVLQEGGEHVPWVEEDEGDDEPEEVRRDQRHDQREENLVFEEVGDVEEVVGELKLDRLDRDEDGGEHEVADPG